MRVFPKISVILVLVILSISTCTSIRRGIVSFFSFDGRKKAESATKDSLLIPTEQALDPALAIGLKKLATGFESITDLKFLPGDSERVVVLEKSGSAHLLHIPSGRKTLLLNVTVATASELGLLGLAFHPEFKKNQLFYVHYNPRSDLSRIEEWKWIDGLTSQADTAVVTKAVRKILEVDQPYQNHNGGSLVFGPDKMLYIGFGDGGWRGDPENRGQNLKTLLGKMLRIDVDRPDSASGRAYGIPKDNPFVGNAKAEPEIYAYGLRNPWKYSFDVRGRLIAADVGQDKWEEVSIVPAGGNMGWRIFEGNQCYSSADLCDAHRKDVVHPVAVYDHSQGASVTGGFQYAGKELKSLKGRYLFGDFISGRIWSIDLPDAAPRLSTESQTLKLLGKWDILISTFAEDASGELYVADFSSGSIYKIVSPGRRNF
jgi:glucose/arabinose dehydrogenase